MSEAITFIRIHLECGDEVMIYGAEAEKAMQKMVDAFWQEMGTDYVGSCWKREQSVGSGPTKP